MFGLNMGTESPSSRPHRMRAKGRKTTPSTSAYPPPASGLGLGSSQMSRDACLGGSLNTTCPRALGQSSWPYEPQPTHALPAWLRHPDAEVPLRDPPGAHTPTAFFTASVWCARRALLHRPSLGLLRALHQPATPPFNAFCVPKVVHKSCGRRGIGAPSAALTSVPPVPSTMPRPRRSSGAEGQCPRGRAPSAATTSTSAVPRHAAPTPSPFGVVAPFCPGPPPAAGGMARSPQGRGSKGTEGEAPRMHEDQPVRVLT